MRWEGWKEQSRGRFKFQTKSTFIFTYSSEEQKVHVLSWLQEGEVALAWKNQWGKELKVEQWPAELQERLSSAGSRRRGVGPTGAEGYGLEVH